MTTRAISLPLSCFIYRLSEPKPIEKWSTFIKKYFWVYLEEFGVFWGILSIFFRVYWYSATPPGRPCYVVQIAIVATGFRCRTAADKLRFILSDSQCLRVFNWSFPLFLRGEGCSYFRKRKSADIYVKYPFLISFRATDGNHGEI